METYRRGRIAFESGLPSPVPVARAVKQQLFRSFHENALKNAQVLGDSQNLLAELEAGGPRQATELVAEIEGCRSATPDAVREFRKVRALFFSSLSTVAGDFEQYSQALLGNNADRQSYMKSYVALTRQIRQAQMSDPIAEQVLKLRIPGLTFLLFNGMIGNLEKERSVRHQVLTNPSFRQLLDAMKQEAPSDVLFACHGTYAQDDPENSRLMFGDSDGTSFWQIFSELDLTGSRSVVLGACESGLSRSEVDAEYLGFTGAFHSAGADYVLGSLWQVNQLSTAILIDRYFELLEDIKANRPEALRCAQKDLMRMDRAEVLAWVGKNCGKMPIAFQRKVQKAVQRLDPEPFAHPQWWAGFFISGA